MSRKSTVLISPIVLHIRGYAEALDVEAPLATRNEEYNTHTIVTVDDLGHARAMGLLKVTSEQFNDFLTELKLFGISKISWRHNGREHTKNLI